MKKIIYCFLVVLVFVSCAKNYTVWMFKENFYNDENNIKFYTNSKDSTWYMLKALPPVTIKGKNFLHLLFLSETDYFNFRYNESLVLIENDIIYLGDIDGKRAPETIFDFNLPEGEKYLACRRLFPSFYGYDSVMLSKKYYHKNYNDSVFQFSINRTLIVAIGHKMIPVLSQIEISKKIGIISFHIIDNLVEKKYELYNGVVHFKDNRKDMYELIPFKD